MTSPLFGTQVRKSPYFERTRDAGCTSFSIYNHILTPRDFGDVDANYRAITERVVLIDATPQRQVEVVGPDALAFVQTLTPRNLERFKPGQSRYALITAPNGGVISDPVITFTEDGRIWLSAADGDLILWVLGLAENATQDVAVREVDVAAMQVQGPASVAVMEAVVGAQIHDLQWYRNGTIRVGGTDVLITRTGWTSELGFELYPLSEDGPAIWDRVVDAGQAHGLAVGHTSTARRIEGGILAMIADMDIQTTALEVASPKLLDLDQPTEFVGKAALLAERERGARREIVGMIIDGPAFPHPNEEYWQVHRARQWIGTVTSAVFSPRLSKNIAIGLIEANSATLGDTVDVETGFGARRAEIVRLPFYDADKSIPRGAKTWPEITGDHL
ncbi:glycine cleavage T C-terminal barrel domain-containing protein [Euryhalocaulis caribicus]|uniref:glycine cleavage T C-terminal barrel domain-containing protein n=1 Tax=Euryhalocaulis caribicus TaxID=1161401 RepID=UPI00039BE9DF|nr:glycine cleavage T C-terminal barrel domain-containing protein [Euryhalocaulis caribicus]